VNLRFAEAPPLPLTEPTMTFFEKVLAFGRDDLLRFAELAVFALVTLIVLIFVVRPLLREMMSPEVAGPVLAAAASAPTAPNEAATATATSTATADSAPALERLGSRIASQPQDAAAILRSWMRNAA